ncbi:MAG: substrate-binding periplasmic protein [Desulfococcaceae bacterium]
MMKNFFIFVLIILGLTMQTNLWADEKQLEVITFHYPPVMGESSLSKEGILVELVRAAFASQKVPITVTYLPVKRAISQITSNKSLAYIGVKNTFDAKVQPHIQEYPFFVSRFLLFYRKDRFPKGFSYQKLSDLKNYRIGVLAGGTTDVVGRANNLDIDPAYDLDLVFKKLDAKRDDLGVASEFSIELMLHDLFKDRAAEYGINKEVPFHSINSVLLLNDRHPDFAYFEQKLKAGMKEISKNGQWQQILEQFYGAGNIPAVTRQLFETAVAAY